MTDESTPKATAVVVGQIPGVASGLSALASAHAPFIYFDVAPNFGLNGGIANLSREVVRSLKAALERVELIASSTPGTEN